MISTDLALQTAELEYASVRKGSDAHREAGQKLFIAINDHLYVLTEHLAYGPCLPGSTCDAEMLADMRRAQQVIIEKQIEVLSSHRNELVGELYSYGFFSAVQQ
jgi:hypothetical protein